MAELLTVLVITFFAVVSPGPDFAMVTRNSLVSGKRAGVITALGISIGVWVHVAYSLIGIGAIISQSIILFNILKFVCALYLIYFGIKMIIDARKSSESFDPYIDKVDMQSVNKSAFMTGFLTNALNPKTTIFFVSLFTQFISPETELAVMLLYGLIISLAHLVWFICVAYFFSASILRSKLLGFKHWLDRAFGILITSLGISIMASSVQNR